MNSIFAHDISPDQRRRPWVAFISTSRIRSFAGIGLFGNDMRMPSNSLAGHREKCFLNTATHAM